IPRNSRQGVELHLDDPVRRCVTRRHNFRYELDLGGFEDGRAVVTGDDDIGDGDPARPKPDVDRLHDHEARDVRTQLQQVGQTTRDLLMRSGRGRTHDQAPVQQLDPTRRLAKCEVVVLGPGPEVLKGLHRHVHFWLAGRRRSASFLLPLGSTRTWGCLGSAPGAGWLTLLIPRYALLSEQDASTALPLLSLTQSLIAKLVLEPPSARVTAVPIPASTTTA